MVGGWGGEGGFGGGGVIELMTHCGDSAHWQVCSSLKTPNLHLGCLPAGCVRLCESVLFSVCACACSCVRACVCACVCVCYIHKGL